jgi:hypothetical protein
MLSFSGEYTKWTGRCPNCEFEPRRPDSLFNHIMGFYEHYIGLVFVAECPKCFHKWSAHAGDFDYYDYFLYSIEEGTNLHFKEIE